MKTAPLRIGYLIQDFPPEVGAGPARAIEMAQRWENQGAQVTAIVGMPNRRLPGRGEGGVDPRYRGRLFIEEKWEGIRTLRSWLYTGSGRGSVNKAINNASFMLSSFLHAAVRREDYDVLIASSPPMLPHVSGAALSRVRGIPLVLELRDLWPDYMVELGMLNNQVMRRALFSLEARLLRTADHVVVVTESFERRVIAKGVRRDRIDVIPNGVDVTVYRPADSTTDVLQVKAPGDFIVGYLGTFGKGQALEQVVHAAHLLASADAGIRFVLVGDGPELPRVRSEIGRLGVTSIDIRPPIERAATRAFYNWCDVCLVPLADVPIFSETVPSKLFEVMACSRPLVATVSGEAAGIVRASGAGVVSKPGDAQGLADAILRVRAITDGERSRMGQLAREYVSSRYNRLTLADKYLGILKTVAARGRLSPKFT